MRPRILFLVVVGGTLWLFLTDDGRRRRAQVLRLLGRGPGVWETGPARSGVAGDQLSAAVLHQPSPVPFPQAPPEGAGGRAAAQPMPPVQEQQPATAPTPEDATLAAAAPATEPTMPVPAGTAAASESTAPVAGAEPAGQPAGVSAPAPTPEDTTAAPPMPAQPPPREHPTPDIADRDAPSGDRAAPPSDADAAGAVDQGPGEGEDRQREEPAPHPRLEEVLRELGDETEVHAIGQEPEVKVEEGLDRTTLAEIGIPPAEPAAAQAPREASPQPPEAPAVTQSPLPAPAPEAPPAAAAEPAAGEQPAAPAATGGDKRWIGNKRKMVAHPPGSLRLPAEENRVFFASRDEAIAAGYRVVEREEH